jgi:hypothetical protein
MGLPTTDGKTHSCHVPLPQPQVWPGSLSRLIAVEPSLHMKRLQCKLSNLQRWTLAGCLGVCHTHCSPAYFCAGVA